MIIRYSVTDLQERLYCCLRQVLLAFLCVGSRLDYRQGRSDVEGVGTFFSLPSSYNGRRGVSALLAESSPRCTLVGLVFQFHFRASLGLSVAR